MRELSVEIGPKILSEVMNRWNRQLRLLNVLEGEVAGFLEESADKYIITVRKISIPSRARPIIGSSISKEEPRSG